MMDASDNGPATVQRHLQGGEAELVVDAFGNAPADDFARIDIENSGQKNKARADTNVGDVASPRLVGSVEGLVPKQIGVNPAAMFGVGGDDETAPKNRTEPEFQHHPPDPLGIDGLSAAGQFFLDPTVPIAGKLDLYGFDLITQSSIALLLARTVDSGLIVVGARRQTCHFEPFRY